MSGLQFLIAFQALLQLAFQTSTLFVNGQQLTTKSLPGCPDKTKTWNRTYVVNKYYNTTEALYRGRNEILINYLNVTYFDSDSFQTQV